MRYKIELLLYYTNHIKEMKLIQDNDYTMNQFINKFQIDQSVLKDQIKQEYQHVIHQIDYFTTLKEEEEEEDIFQKEDEDKDYVYQSLISKEIIQSVNNSIFTLTHYIPINNSYNTKSSSATYQDAKDSFTFKSFLTRIDAIKSLEKFIKNVYMLNIIFNYILLMILNKLNV